MTVIMMPLRNEGTDTWRPVQATEVAAGIYRIEGTPPVNHDEEWAFGKGEIVVVEMRTCSDGRARLTAMRKAAT